MLDTVALDKIRNTNVLDLFQLRDILMDKKSSPFLCGLAAHTTKKV